MTTLIDPKLARLIRRSALAAALLGAALAADGPPVRHRSAPPVISSSWDDLLEGIKTRADWDKRRQVLKKRYLELIRDDQKPKRKPALNLKVHETKVVDGCYKRLLVSYNVEADERAHANLGIPLQLARPAPAVVALHGTHPQGMKMAAGLIANGANGYDNAYLDHLCRRGFVVIAPEHFVSGERIPPEGAYDTMRFYKKHPEWTAVGKFTYEHSLAVDVLETRAEVDRVHIGVMGHSLGGHGAYFLAAYDERIKAAVCNCGGGGFRHDRKVEEWARDHWYVYFKHIRPGLLAGELPPIDIHEILALIAPRAYLEVLGLNDGDPLQERQEVLMLLKVADIYQLVGKPENMGFFAHGRGHSVRYESRALIYSFLEAHLKPPQTTESHGVEE
jgi:dienelactone hydrolase